MTLLKKRIFNPEKEMIKKNELLTTESDFLGFPNWMESRPKSDFF
jgi:hypothetical protein